MKQGEKATDLFCCRCGEIYHGSVKDSFTGMLLFSCPACGHANKFPPGKIWVGCLGLIFAGTCVGWFTMAMQGNFVLPGGIGLLILFVFQAAVSAVIRVRQARKFHQTRGRLPADWKGW